MHVNLSIVLMSFLNVFDINYQYLFHHFMRNFEKDYSINSFDQKFEIFKENVQFIYKHNQNYEKNFTLGINQFTDLTNDEFKDFVKSSKPKLYDFNKCDPMVTVKNNLPDSIDWREKNAVTEVKDQGQCGSCWSFSATGAIEGVNSIVNKFLQSFSEQELVDCSNERPYHNHGCNGGLMDSAFSYVIDNGLCDDKDYPYDAKENECRSGQCKPKVKINKCYDVTPNNQMELKKAVSMQPVSVAIEADTRYFQSYKSGVLTSEACGTDLDHGVLVVGYGSEDGVDFWLVKNSWSSSWGEDGFVKIERTDSTNSEGVCGIAMEPSYPSF